jgi:hypothetical protein
VIFEPSNSDTRARFSLILVCNTALVVMHTIAFDLVWSFSMFLNHQEKITLETALRRTNNAMWKR